jgi:hypothetical protein
MSSLPLARRLTVSFATTNSQETICTAKLPEGRATGMWRVTRRAFSEKESLPGGSASASMLTTVAANETVNRLGSLVSLV